MFREFARALAVASGIIAATTAQAATFTVINTDDAGAGSLRNAILSANSTPGADLINFDAALMGGTITLSTGALFVTDALTISGLDDLDPTTVTDTVTVDGATLFQIFVVSAPTTINSLIMANGLATANGGCISNSSTLRINDSTINTCDATNFSGGGIFNAAAGQLTLFRSVVGTGTAENGGGIYNAGTATLIESTVTGSTANDDGGGIFSETSLALTRSEVSGNSATDDGGGIFARGVLNVTTSTVTGNSTSDAASSGGGVFADNGTTTTLLYSTLSTNDTPATGTGSGLQITAPGTVNITNSIIADNFNAADCTSPVAFTLLGINLTDHASCAGFTVVMNADLNLQALATNGNLANPTQTHALGAMSVALDRIKCKTGVDQRNVGRVDGLCDVGAYEDQISVAGPACTAAPLACGATFTRGKLQITQGKTSDAMDAFRVQAKGATPDPEDFGDPNADPGDAQSLCVYDGTDTLVDEYNIDAGGADVDTGKLFWKVKLGEHAKASYNNPAGNADGVNKVKLAGGEKGRFELKARGAVLEETAPLPELADFPLTIQQVSSNGFCAEIVFDEPEEKSGKIKAKEK